MSVSAAFFDVDRTLLAGSSGLHLARPFRRRGLLSARQLARTLLAQLAFTARGTNDQQLDRYTQSVTALMRGWDHDTVVSVVADELERRVKPMVFRDALERIEQHRARGERVYAVSAMMEEIIEPLAHLLDLDGFIATKMDVVDGAFSGRIVDSNHGADKARRVRAFAAEHGIDLERSSAYSDSITDEEFLRCAAHRYAVNPDKQLRELAEREGWSILRFDDRIRMPLHRRRAARVGMAALAGGVALRMARQRRRA